MVVILMYKIKLNKTLAMMMCSFLIIGSCLGFMASVNAEMVKTTIFEEGFEEEWVDSLPSSNWIYNSGWLDGLYPESGGAHSGNHWAFSWAAGDKLTTKSITFGNDTELSFWYKPENSVTPMTLEVYIDDTILILSIEDMNNLNYIQANIDLSNYTGDHTISFKGMTSSGTYGQLLDDVKITSYFEEGDVPPGDDDDDTAPPVIPPAENTPPVADLSNGEPYQGYTNGTVMFDGTKSEDPDSGDEIVKWFWNFGDNTTKPGETVLHSYENEGTYTVTLHVIDSNGGEGTDTSTVTIQKGNNPPSIPRVEQKGSFSIEKILILKNQSGTASFMVSSTDSDEDNISFAIDWGDGIKETTETAESGDRVYIAHSWMSAGRYDISVIATDTSDAASEKTSLVVFMNLGVEKISGDVSGYLYSNGSETDYSHFYRPDLDIETDIEKDENNQYLIDSDGDDEWDYVYNTTTGLMAYQSDTNPIGKDDKSGSDTPGFGVLLFSVALCLFALIQRKRR